MLCAACLPSPDGASVSRYDGLTVYAAGDYGGVLRRAILALKTGRREVAGPLARLVTERWAHVVPRGAVLAAVPTTAARRRARGYDQAVVLARACGAHMERAVVPLLWRTGGGAQHGRTRGARLEAAGRFACSRPCRGLVVVLVDDVVTTGATLCDCARTLRAAGADVPAALVVARTLHR